MCYVWDPSFLIINCLLASKFFGRLYCHCAMLGTHVSFLINNWLLISKFLWGLLAQTVNRLYKNRAIFDDCNVLFPFYIFKIFSIVMYCVFSFSFIFLLSECWMWLPLDIYIYDLKYASFTHFPQFETFFLFCKTTCKMLRWQINHHSFLP